MTATGPKPTARLRSAGFTLDLTTKVRDPDLAGIAGLEELLSPLVVGPCGGGTEALIYPRLLGFDHAKDLVPPASVWDRDLGAWRTTCLDLAPRGRPRKGLLMSPDIVAVAVSEAGRVTTKTHLRTQAAHVAQSLGTNTDPAHLADLITDVGDVPAWFGGDIFTLYPYQRAGAVAIAAGHGYLCDSPGVGKTLTALAAAAIVGARRTLVLCPAKVISSWVRHATACGLATLGGSEPDGQAVAYVPGRKPPPLPDTGVVVMTDTLASLRGELRQELCTWAPDVLIYDEAHRAKGWETARASAARELAAATTRLRIAATGTPMNSNPHEIASQLEVTGHLGPVFGGLSTFMQTYCRKNHFNAWVARPDALPKLHEQLNQHVWVRRVKDDVLADLPGKSRYPLLVDVPLTDFRAAHTDVLDRIDQWLADLDHTLDQHDSDDQDLVATWSRGQIGLMSPLRVAAGLAKVKAAAEFIADWTRAEVSTEGGQPTIGRPLSVWVHHHDVLDALAKAARAVVPDASMVRTITGSDRQNTADAAVRDFQAGKVAVLLCSITAAGVGITLTRGCDALFVETTYVNSEISQAEDRHARIGQTRPVSCYTMIAPGTLDERIQKVLASKADILEPVLPGGDNRVAVWAGEGKGGELASPSQIVETLVWEAVARRRTRARTR